MKTKGWLLFLIVLFIGNIASAQTPAPGTPGSPWTPPAAAAPAAQTAAPAAPAPPAPAPTVAPVPTQPGAPISTLATCGNGVKDAGEVCDGRDLGGSSCASTPGFVMGVLTCKASCAAFETSQCMTGAQAKADMARKVASLGRQGITPTMIMGAPYGFDLQVDWEGNGKVMRRVLMEVLTEMIAAQTAAQAKADEERPWYKDAGWVLTGLVVVAGGAYVTHGLYCESSVGNWGCTTVNVAP